MEDDQPGRESLLIKDGSGCALVVLGGPLPGAALDAILPGDYLLVIGPLVEQPQGKKAVRAHKVGILLLESVPTSSKAID